MADRVWKVTGKIKIDGVVQRIDDTIFAKSESAVKSELNKRRSDYPKGHSVGKPYDLKIVEDKSGTYK